MPKSKKPAKRQHNPLDTFSEKRARGRPHKIRASEVYGRADNYRQFFTEIWDLRGEQLLRATTEEEVRQVFERTPYQHELAHIAWLILKVLHDPDFPKRDKEARINFLGDSLAARGVVTARSSRDICAKERAKEKKRSAHKILRHEYYVECSCGYKGPARDNACRRCGAEISFLIYEIDGGLF